MNNVIPNVKLAVNIRPIQFAYFYRKGNKRDLLKIFKYLNTQWGGIYNLIIPINSNGKTYPFYEQILKIHTPDQFVSTLNNEIHEKLKNNLSKILSQKEIEISHFEIFEKVDHSAHLLGFISEKAPRHLLCPKVSNIKNRELIQLALFGEIYPIQINDYKKKLSLQSYENVDTSNQIISSQFWIEPFYSPINFTSINIKTYSVGNGFFTSADIIDLVIGDDENSISYFWNLRALRERGQINKTNNYGRRVLLLPLEMLYDNTAFKKFFTEIKELLPGPQKNCNLNVCVDHIPKKLIPFFEEKMKSLDFVKKFDDDQVRVTLGNSGFEERKLTYDLQYPQWLGFDSKMGTGKRNILVQDLNINNNQITFYPPDGFSNNYLQSVVIDIISDIWKSFPKSRLVAQSMRSNSYFSKYGLTSFSLASKNTNSFEFKLLDDWTKIKLFFEEKGYEIKPSKITSYSAAIINLLGGINNLNVLNNSLVINLLDVLSVKSSKKLVQKILNKIDGRSQKEETLLKIFNEFNLAPELKSIPKTYEELRTLPRLSLIKSKILSTLNELSKMQIIKRGFYIECNRCGLKEWYSLGSSDEFLICPGCDQKFILPIEENKNVETKWRYRLNSLMNRAIDQDIITGLVSVGHLIQKRNTFCHYFGIELKKASNKNAKTDIDFCFVENQKIHIGECKTSDGFSKKDFNNAKLFADLGVDEFYFCTLTTLSEVSLSKINKLKESLRKKNMKMNISTLTSDELFKKV
ncbi:MAG TPA: hypothetical protein VKA26_12405 [Ignavibacteriaceae bacterium]|nr:hypothetical protein [Ignavibacteriaceae bacterium]